MARQPGHVIPVSVSPGLVGQDVSVRLQPQYHGVLGTQQDVGRPGCLPGGVDSLDPHHKVDEARLRFFLSVALASLP